MATNQMSGFIQRLRRVLRDGAGLTDGQLLGDYLSRRDEAAIAALVRRHGPMVWGVCRRVLHNHHDAEDAFQTTFLVLVRKAASIASRELLANWLYGVAHQTALKARATAAKRKGRERQATEMPEPAVAQQDPWRDVQPLLDEELSRLPGKYRSVIVLCDLECKTRKEAAAQLRCPEGTVAGRLARARIMLAKRLTRRGVALSGGALAAALSQQAASAVVPTSVTSSTINAATLLAAGKAAGAISVKVAALTEGVMKAMLFSKLKTVLAVVVILGFVATGATVLTCRTAAGQDDKKPQAEKPVATSAKQEAEKKEEFAWGKEVNGLQLCLALLPADEIAYCPGDKIQCEVRVRNVSNAPIAIVISYGRLNQSRPEIRDAQGEKVRVAMPPSPRFYVVPTERILKPGETVTLYKPEVAVEEVLEGKADPTTVVSTPTIRVRPGKYKIALGGMVQSHPTLSTGAVEFEVKDKNAKESPEKKEAFTSWGKEAGGLQAGLGYRPGEHRAYHIGETVTLVVRVRNVGKEEDGKPHVVKFQYLRNFFMEKPPTVTDGEGRPVPFAYGVFDLAAAHLPVDVNLAPGKEIELYELKLDLRPASESGKAMISTLYGMGKFQMQYERVFGNSSAGQIKLDSALSKLATGKLELEVKLEPPPAATEVKTQVKKVMVKENYTSWAKEVGGLQAGLGYRAGERRPYHYGETVTLVVRVRNVSKEEVKFQYLRPYFIENPPIVTDADGKTAPQWRIDAGGLVHVPEEVSLAPGKEMELAAEEYELKPAREINNRKASASKFLPLYVTGKVSLQYERVFGNSSLGKIKIDPTLSELGTGKLELEVKPEAAPKDDKEAEKPDNPRVSLAKTKATVEGQLDEASTLVLRIGEEKDKLFWEARRKDTPGSAMVRFSEEGAKRFWGDKARTAGAFKAVVELSDKILMSDGKFATGFIYNVAVCEGAATEKQSLIGSTIYVPIPKTGSLQDFLARSLAGDAMPFGELLLREESKVVRKDGVVTFADVQKGDGKLVPVSFVIKKKTVTK